MFKPSTSFHL